MGSILTEREFSILSQLSVGASYGLRLVAGSSGGVSKSDVYVTLGRMEVKGLIAPRGIDRPPRGKSGPPRRMYRITDAGKRALSAHRISVSVMDGGKDSRSR